ncbi:hypothetical protein AAHE18_18G193900 [Arachis hypogaea]
MLVDYVNKHGEGNWNAVQKYSGLLRCGKSCRLRWANHLRPNLKKGAFTAEEERLIAELHAKMGNKWARMAAHLPGRTDNEIKNYWNTRIKRRQRAGLPLYPPELCVQAVQENQHGRSSGGIDGGNNMHHDFVHKNYEIHSAIFDSWNGSQGILPYPPELPDISAYTVSALESDCSSPQNSGLLDALLYQARTLSNSKNHYSDKSSNSSTATPCDRALSSTLNKYETDWEDYTDTISPFGATSILNECTVASASANSLDEHPTVRSFNDNIVKTENVDQVWSPNSENQGMSAIKITRPDVLLASDWLQQGSGHDMRQGSMADDIPALREDDLATDSKHTSSGTSLLSQVCGFGSCGRSVMPAFCQGSDRG